VRLPREQQKTDHRRHCEKRAPANLRLRGSVSVREQIVRPNAESPPNITTELLNR
jgi:hypothetical protein